MASERYQKQLADPKWQRKRLEIFNRDNFHCTICDDDTVELHVHHKKYERDKKAHEYDDSNFVSLCAHCHKLLTYYQIDLDVSKMIAFRSSSEKMYFVFQKEDQRLNAITYNFSEDVFYQSSSFFESHIEYLLKFLNKIKENFTVKSETV